MAAVTFAADERPLQWLAQCGRSLVADCSESMRRV